MIIVFLTIIIIIVFITIFFLYNNTEEDYFYRKDIPIKSFSPHLENPESRNLKILIFNSYSYPKGLPQYAKHSIALNQKYARKHDYTYRQIEHSPSELPPYWLRVKDAYDLLLDDKYDVIIYLDLDAIINTDKPITNVIFGNYDIFIGEDIIPSYMKFVKNPINNLLNSGCFIVRNTDWSKSFIKKWLNICTENICSERWKYTNFKWECPRCTWAGQYYEQGSLAKMYLQNIDDAKDHICIYSAEVLTNTDHSKESPVLHLLGHSDTDRYNIFEKIAKSYLRNNHQHNHETSGQ